MTGAQDESAAFEQPLVCMYLFLDAEGETVPPHPSPRTASPLRYLECALVQAASLRLAGAQCGVALVTNLDGGRGLSRGARRLLGALADLGVQLLPLALRIEPGTGAGATRMPREAIRVAAAAGSGARVLWVPNLDTVWADPDRALRAPPPPGAVGCLAIPYPPEWPVGGSVEIGASRAALGARAAALGGDVVNPPPWIGADLLAGTAATLTGLADACDELDEDFARQGLTATNEQLLTLAAALGRVTVADLSALARRIQTGARHDAGTVEDASELAIWHLPAEKGLSFRRTARLLARGGHERLRRELSAPATAMARFNVGPARRARQLRDDAWVARARAVPAPRPRAAGTLQPIDHRVGGRKD